MAVMVANSLHSAIFYATSAKREGRRPRAYAQGAVLSSHVRQLGTDICNTTSANLNGIWVQSNDESILDYGKPEQSSHTILWDHCCILSVEISEMGLRKPC